MLRRAASTAFRFLSAILASFLSVTALLDSAVPVVILRVAGLGRGDGEGDIGDKAFLDDASELLRVL